MATTIVDGKEVSQRIRESLKAEIAELTAAGRTPGLAVVLVGEDPVYHEQAHLPPCGNTLPAVLL